MSFKRNDKVLFTFRGKQHEGEILQGPSPYHVLFRGKNSKSNNKCSLFSGKYSKVYCCSYHDFRYDFVLNHPDDDLENHLVVLKFTESQLILKEEQCVGMK